MNIDFIIAACRRDTRCIGGIERLALCDEVERLRQALLDCTDLASGQHHASPSDRCAEIAAHIQEVLKHE